MNNFEIEIHSNMVMAKIRTVRDSLASGLITKSDVYEKLMQQPQVLPIVYEIGVKILDVKTNGINDLYRYALATHIFDHKDYNRIMDKIFTFTSGFSDDLICEIDLTKEGNCDANFVVHWLGPKGGEHE